MRESEARLGRDILSCFMATANGGRAKQAFNLGRRAGTVVIERRSHNRGSRLPKTQPGYFLSKPARRQSRVLEGRRRSFRRRVAATENGLCVVPWFACGFLRWLKIPEDFNLLSGWRVLKSQRGEPTFSHHSEDRDISE